MPIQLNWSDDTTGIEKQFIYRSTSSIDPNNLPVALAEVPANTFTYTDNTVVQGQLYYYVIASQKNGQLSISRQIPMAYLIDTGPGPSTIVRGNWEWGYFGTIPLADLADATTIKTALGDTAMAIGNAVNWYKMAYKGKVIFFPDGNLFSNAGWTWLYTNGWAYGDLPVPQFVKTAHGDIPQNKTMTLGSRIYRFRLPTSSPDYMVAKAADTGGDVDILFANMCFNRTYYLGGTLGLLSDNGQNNGSQVYLTLNLTGELASSPVVTRGSISSTSPNHLIVDAIGANASKANQAGNRIRPILELVP